MAAPNLILNRAPNLEGLRGEWYIVDTGAKCDGQTDDTTRIQFAISAAQGNGGGLVVFPGGGATSLISATLLLPSNVFLYLPAGTTLKLMDGSNCDVITNYDTSGGNTNLGIFGGGTVDCNRSQNTTGSRDGLGFWYCTRVQVNDIEIKAPRSDGIAFYACEYCAVTNAYVHDAGQHGIALTYTRRSQLTGCSTIDCSRVVTSGNGDGVNLDLLSSDNTITNHIAEDTYSNSPRMGYGIREAVSSLCERNAIVGGTFTNMQTGRVRLESGDSLSLAPGAVNLPSGVTIMA